MEFTDIDKNLIDGQNMGGIAQYVFFALHADVATWPAKPVAPANPSENGTLTGDLIMKAGKKMFSMYLTDDTGEFEIESVGEKDGKSFVLHLRLFHPGLNPEILGFINAAKNENLVFVVPDNNGKYFLMGDQKRTATFEGSDEGMGTKKETAGRRGIGMHFTYKAANVYEYTGSIPRTPATSGSEEYNITYNSNGDQYSVTGEPPADTNTYNRYQLATVLGKNTLAASPVVYYFAGWCRNSNGSGTVYQPGSQIVVTENITLYAVWLALPGIADQYEGGVVAYVLTNADAGYEETKHKGIIVATDKEFVNKKWSVLEQIVGTEDHVGAGTENTIAIIASDDDPDIAARLCFDLEHNGYSDWYLPNKGEILKIMVNREYLGNNFAPPPVWPKLFMSSSELSNNELDSYYCISLTAANVVVNYGDMKTNPTAGTVAIPVRNFEIEL